MTDAQSLMETKHITDIFMRLMHSLMNDNLRTCSDDLTIAQINALKHIRCHDQCTISGLSQGLGISQPAATMLVDRLCRRGLVTRCASQDDRRQSVVSVTDEAGDMINRVDRERMNRFGAILDIMDAESRQSFVECLSKFIEAAVKADPHARESCLQCGDDHRPDCVISRIQQETSDI